MNFRFVTLVAPLLLTSTALAGDLNPPPGSVAPSMKTLDDVESRIAINDENTLGNVGATFIIPSPGSYYLTSDIQGEIDKHGIDVNASDVTIDLNGFTIVGSEDSKSPVNGIEASSIGNLTVLNGNIKLFSNNGINAGSAARVHGVRTIENNGAGMVLGSGANIAHCVSSSNGADGITVGSRAIISNTHASGCGAAGINADDAARIVDCTANANGAQGIITSVGASISGCTASGNLAEGFSGGTTTVIVDCTANDNTLAGILAAGGSTVENCTAHLNLGGGISATFASIVRSCSTRSNHGNGITVFQGGMVIDCVCSNNGVASDGAGILVNGNNSRIEGNTVTDNDRGIDVDASNNLIVGNSAGGNGVNYDISLTNAVGTIQTSPVGAGSWDNFEF